MVDATSYSRLSLNWWQSGPTFSTKLGSSISGLSYSPSLSILLLQPYRKDEYLKHGTCSGLSEYKYFSKVLDIYDHLAPLGIVFQNANIVPDNKRGYAVSVWSRNV